MFLPPTPHLAADSCVAHFPRGLKKCQERSFRLPNFIRAPLILRIVDHELPGIEFDHAAFSAFLVSMRAPLRRSP